MQEAIKVNLLILLFLLAFTSLYAQHSRFNAGIVAGLNFSQLEGEKITDYFGLNTGIIGSIRLSKHAQLATELLFSQNGEYILPERYPQLQYGKVWLNHIEIPVHIDWLIGVFQRDKFYDWNLNLGVAYTKLISHRAKDINQVDVTDQIVYENREGYLLQAGTTYHFTKKVGLNLKASLPMRVDGLSWTLAARIMYTVY